MPNTCPPNATNLHRLLACLPRLALWWHLWLTGCLLSCSLPAVAGDSILLVHDGKSEMADEIIQSLSQQLTSQSMQIELLDISSQPLPENTALQPYTALVTLGSQAAAITLAQNPPVNSLSLLLTKQTWSSLKHPDSEYSRSVLMLDQPIDRQLHLIRAIFGDDSRTGILLGPSSATFRTELNESARPHKQKLDIRTIQQADELIPALGNLVDNIDALLALPDAMIYNKRSIQGILLLTYRSKTPVIGFSQAYARAGAVASLYSSAQDIAQHATEIILAKPAGERIFYPKYFSITFNQQVARTLGISPPDTAQLISHISKEENSR